MAATPPPPASSEPVQQRPERSLGGRCGPAHTCRASVTASNPPSDKRGEGPATAVNAATGFEVSGLAGGPREAHWRRASRAERMSPSVTTQGQARSLSAHLPTRPEGIRRAIRVPFRVRKAVRLRTVRSRALTVLRAGALRGRRRRRRPDALRDQRALTRASHEELLRYRFPPATLSRLISRLFSLAAAMPGSGSSITAASGRHTPASLPPTLRFWQRASAALREKQHCRRVIRRCCFSSVAIVAPAARQARLPRTSSRVLTLCADPAGPATDRRGCGGARRRHERSESS